MNGFYDPSFAEWQRQNFRQRLAETEALKRENRLSRILLASLQAQEQDKKTALSYGR